MSGPTGCAGARALHERPADETSARMRCIRRAPGGPVRRCGKPEPWRMSYRVRLPQSLPMTGVAGRQARPATRSLDDFRFQRAQLGVAMSTLCRARPMGKRAGESFQHRREHLNGPAGPTETVSQEKSPRPDGRRRHACPRPRPGRPDRRACPCGMEIHVRRTQAA
jgi:hypothetical protein